MINNERKTNYQNKKIKHEIIYHLSDDRIRLYFLLWNRSIILSQVKGTSDVNIVLSSSIYAMSHIVLQMPTMVIVNKIGKQKSILLRKSSKNSKYFISHRLL